MNASPQSQAVIDALLRGEELTSGDFVLGPLSEDAMMLLRLLIDNYDDLTNRRGADRANALRDAWVESLAWQEEISRNASGESLHAEPPESTEVDPKQPSSSCSSTRPRWKLVNLECHSIRGLAPPGKEIGFPFDGKSNLIFGPNGSGKSSLLGAVVWLFTQEVKPLPIVKTKKGLE